MTLPTRPIQYVLFVLFVLFALIFAPPAYAASSTLTLGVVQMALEPDLAQNRDKIVRFIGDASAKGCRAVVFPESALFWQGSVPKADIDAAIAAIQNAARAHAVYVVFCAMYKRTEDDKPFNYLLVIDPSGRVIQRYHKLWSDARSNNVPGLFHIDGVPCAAIICADRWIRGVEDLPAIAGARILFECSCNYADEWVPDLGWYWYVPRALRNGVYVIFSNTASNPAFPNDLALHNKHGHSAVVAPDGTLPVAAGVEPDRLLVAALDLARGSREEALRRRRHPLFAPFWEAGVTILNGGTVKAPALRGHTSPATSLTIAAAQLAPAASIAENVARMRRMIAEARAKNADVVVFPELAVTGAADRDILAADPAALDAALRELQAAAAAERIHVVFGMPCTIDGQRRNCAIALDPRGAILTRHAQLVVDQPALFAPGAQTRSMWFRVNGVPAVVTIGRREALWSELAELAAVRGAQLHLHLEHDADTTTQGALLRRQLWANLASFWTLTATVNATGDSTIWDDFRRARKRTPTGYGSYCAVPLARAGAGDEIICATQTVARSNPQFGNLTGKTNPQMTDWYKTGAHVIGF